jgi:Zn ribbon nucleic-acid-binding protein
MDSEVRTQLEVRIQKRLEAETGEGLVDAWVWILLGALLRNEIKRLLYRYRADFSLFEEENAPASLQTDSSDDYEYYYEGDDMEKRFPGIEWYCDRCNERLDLQKGFHDFVHIWKCTNCGFKNRIEVDEIYDSEQDYLAGNAASDRQKLFRALKERTDELDKLV